MRAVRIVLSATGHPGHALFFLLVPLSDITRLPCEKLPAGSLPDNQKEAPVTHSLLAVEAVGVRALSPGAPGCVPL